MPSIAMGSTLLFSFMETIIVPESKKDRIPNQYEAFHYPYLFAGFLALFFTALNMLPIGQLDGGHVIYGMFGSKNHAIISRVFFLALIFYSGLGLISPYSTQGGEESFFNSTLFSILLYILFLFYILRGFGKDPWTRLTWAVGVFAAQYLAVQFFPNLQGFNGWLLLAFLIGRFVGIDYPRALNEAPLSQSRIILGWFALLVLILSFSPAPLVVTGF
jgi:membrane-associated protease RseP (regulator of RpoE activity)